ncbi:MAG: adenosylcobinamide amidohydrolase [Acidimicrobiales bacterium]
MRAELVWRLEDGQRWPAWVWRLTAGHLVASSASVGGGVGERAWVLNAQVPRDYGRTDLAAHGGELAGALALAGPGVALLTAADVTRARAARDGGVRAHVTAGVDLPTWAAAPDGPGAPAAGTINIVVLVRARLAPGALVNLLTTATEAKAQAQALFEAGIPGTGTPSDAVAVVTSPRGDEEAFGGPRSAVGARVARAVHRALSEALVVAP